MSSSPRILYCHCTNACVSPAETRADVLRALCETGLPFDPVADLCELSARQDPLLRCMAAEPHLLVLACHSRTVRCLFAATGADLPSEGTRIINLRTERPESICAELRAFPNGEMASAPYDFQTLRNQLESAGTPSDGWIPWAPVVDYDRCTGCMQCLSFCLFGVYGVDADSRIEVLNPQQCKTSCPACARVCPEAAILFPKHGADAINGGMTEGAKATHETMKVDLSSLLGGDLYKRLRERNGQPRFSKERNPEQALQERRKYLSALAQAGEIPPEVFQNLPSPEEIARRVADAKANAQAALDKQSSSRAG